VEIEVPNLWPDDLDGETSEVSPFAILKQQAAQLAQATKGILHGTVSREPEPFGSGGFTYEFGINAPALRYNYDLFRLDQKQLDFYPLQCRFENETGEIGSEQEFYTWLKRVFSSEKTRLVVKRLIAQAKA
jgi:hypothetical protein